MKIDGIEILRMARDGELKPKSILKTKHEIQLFDDCRNFDYYIYFGDNQFHRCDENGKLGVKFQNRFLNYEVLAKEFEIIEPVEENEDIEQLDPFNYDEFKNMTSKERFEATIVEYDKINELVIAINKLKKGE